MAMPRLQPTPGGLVVHLGFFEVVGKTNTQLKHDKRYNIQASSPSFRTSELMMPLAQGCTSSHPT